MGPLAEVTIAGEVLAAGVTLLLGIFAGVWAVFLMQLRQAVATARVERDLAALSGRVARVEDRLDGLHPAGVS